MPKVQNVFHIGTTMAGVPSSVFCIPHITPTMGIFRHDYFKPKAHRSPKFEEVKFIEYKPTLRIEHNLIVR